MLGATSKALATIATQPLIVAKVGLQSRPPVERHGKPFKSFGEVMKFILDREGPLGLFKGIGPQILKGFLVQGILMMTKERQVLSFLYLDVFCPVADLTIPQHGIGICPASALHQTISREAYAVVCQYRTVRWASQALNHVRKRHAAYMCT